ncbi:MULTISPECIES: diaminopimelate decarboxylase [unclassified Haematospirillum]|uniref:diaminopimelate decarboxylase n=1 Tax=unclassified Haematospirillum TaxID=2622088 RepID=UPI0014388BDE|nr:MULTISPECIES: diaminopimelate decarboxylase [unclassified Haematospirillum]NKD55645.1 diaminopimelate decarboxylase [Haematospirillum sp. H4890]NKD75170.1 diaminopimelate decarboxylase [Haematospirillum sp. H4485]
MHHFLYRNGTLYAEDVPVSRIVESVGTPCYIYATETLVRHYSVFAKAFHGLDARIHFAVKANSSLAVLRTLAQQGCGADVVSGGELQLALQAGILAERIVFSGVGKTEAELELALKAGVYQINVESLPELGALDAVARHLGIRAPVAIRVNPDIGAGGHEKITTGNRENKFGIEWTMATQVCHHAASLSGIDFKGLAVHIGSQITDLAPFRAAFSRIVTLTRTLRAEGLDVSRLDLGGGLGIPYKDADTAPPLPADYASMVRDTVSETGCTLLLEPGRLIAGNAGILVSRVVYVKNSQTRTFVILDAGMNDLIRPAMYDASHTIIPLAEPEAGSAGQTCDVVGPVCESSDIFARDVMLPPLQTGDRIAFLSAGAYGAVMASQYNTRPLVPEVLVKGDRFAITRRRPSFQDMTALESIPDWLSS